jgi:hypothetical protein
VTHSLDGPSVLVEVSELLNKVLEHPVEQVGKLDFKERVSSREVFEQPPVFFPDVEAIFESGCGECFLVGEKLRASDAHVDLLSWVKY